MMKIYKVGGCVRDELMGLTPNDIDYVVVGSTPAEMESLGFSQVGKDFPVFLHPETNEEYALARKERKTGLKHTDFETVFDPTVTIEEDLMRRDLTINAIAKPHNFEGELVDPFGGQADIRNKILRHVSPAFQEDPLRVVRLARFAARFADFSIHQSTEDLCCRMVLEGSLDHLSKERIFEEFNKALKKPGSWKFVTVMQSFGLDFCKPIRSTFWYKMKRIDQYDWLTEEQQMMLKFAVLFGGFDPAEVKAKMKAISIPTDYIQATMDAQVVIAVAALFEAYERMPPAKQVHALISEVNWASRLQKDPEYINLIAKEFSDSSRVKRVIEAHLSAQKTVQEFIASFTETEGEAPSGRLIAEHIKKTQVRLIHEFIEKSEQARREFFDRTD